MAMSRVPSRVRRTRSPSGRTVVSRRASAPAKVVILGQVQGNVEASDKVDIRKDAKVSWRYHYFPNQH